MRQREYSLIAAAYAEASFGAAKRLGNIEAVGPQAQWLAATLERTPKLLVFLESPQISTENKLALIEKVFGARLDAVLMRLLKLLTKRERAQHLPEILAMLAEMIDESRNIYPATLASGRPLADVDKERLAGSLERYTGKKLRIQWAVEPALIGGMVFRYGDLLIDGSLREGLDNLKRRMLGTALAH